MEICSSYRILEECVTSEGYTLCLAIEGDRTFRVTRGWDDAQLMVAESISTFGVINPVIVRKGEGERYELISGHRRKYACAKLGIDTLPVIVRDLRARRSAKSFCARA